MSSYFCSGLSRRGACEGLPTKLTEARRAEKFFGDYPPSLSPGLDPPPPPLSESPDPPLFCPIQGL